MKSVRVTEKKKETEGERESGGDQDGVNKPFVCPSAAVLPGPSLELGAWHPGSLSFTATPAILALAFSPLTGTGLIMQGLGKTERGEPGRDIDLTSLRSTMPASGPLQVSALRQTERY